ncbi:Uncharacterized protein FWK35_00039331 [Aphis craccivora]|uniref:Uncharacterized protein n=1 Tax=Aphis craccivora TaxID=307492 RepID=A0A6G0XTA9_APHCR|nr:Uncharacterized protein FWK35_00039331 [Aphis craccivora]
MKYSLMILVAVCLFLDIGMVNADCPDRCWYYRFEALDYCSSPLPLNLCGILNIGGLCSCWCC